MPVLRRRVGSVISVVIAGLVAAFLTALALAPAAAAAPDRGHRHHSAASAHGAGGHPAKAKPHSGPTRPDPAQRQAATKPHSVKPHNVNPHTVKPHTAKPHTAKPHTAKPHNVNPHSVVTSHARVATRPTEQPPHLVRAASRPLPSADRSLPAAAKQGLGPAKSAEHGKAHAPKGHGQHRTPPTAPAPGHGGTTEPAHHAVAPVIRPVAVLRPAAAAAPRAVHPPATTHRPHSSPPAPPVIAGGGAVTSPPPPLQRLVQEIKDVAGFSLFGSLVGWAMAGVVLVALAMMAAAFAIGRRRVSSGNPA